MQQIKRILFISLFLLVQTAVPQSNKIRCDFDRLFQQKMNENPAFKQSVLEMEKKIPLLVHQKTDSVVRIPVVFHVIYRNESQNISNQQIISQLQVLNRDYRRKNADTSATPPEFPIGDSHIEFCFAGKDTNGNDFSGITRTYTSYSKIGQSNQLYKVQPVWDRDTYLNIYVCEIGDGIAGYSTFPGTDPAEDAVVIDYKCFGDTGSLDPEYNKGRTCTHEVGHWLGLYHPWGTSQANCTEDDMVADTPEQGKIYQQCPDLPQQSCGSNDMTSNFMGYVYDRCMSAFTPGQGERMRSIIQLKRPELLQSVPCTGFPPTDSIEPTPPSVKFNIYVNSNRPKEFIVNIENEKLSNLSFTLYTLEGKKLPKPRTTIFSETEGTIYIPFSAGIYLLQVNSNLFSTVKKLRVL